jgi:fructose-1,6-bisphosphatase
VPVAVGANVVEKTADDTPAVVEIAPEPDTPVALEHTLSEYRVNATDPVGGTAVVSRNVAVSPTVAVVPTVMEVGSACVVIEGEPGPTTINSLAAAHGAVNPLSFESPA